MDSIKEILTGMTLEQKAAQLIQIPYAFVGREKALEWAKRGENSGAGRKRFAPLFCFEKTMTMRTRTDFYAFLYIFFSETYGNMQKKIV